jgi:hypothetical protein
MDLDPAQKSLRADFLPAAQKNYLVAEDVAAFLYAARLDDAVFGAVFEAGYKLDL